MASHPITHHPVMQEEIPRAFLCPYCGFFCNDSDCVQAHIEQRHIKPYKNFFGSASNE